MGGPLSYIVRGGYGAGVPQPQTQTQTQTQLQRQPTPLLSNPNGNGLQVSKRKLALAATCPNGEGAREQQSISANLIPIRACNMRSMSPVLPVGAPSVLRLSPPLLERASGITSDIAAVYIQSKGTRR